MKYRKVIAERKVGGKIAKSDGRFFVLVEGSDKKIYQVKINLVTTKGNQNEMITHYIGTKMDAPVLDGCILVFSKRLLDSIIDLAAASMQAIPDKSFFRRTELFGVEWHDGAKFANSEDEVKFFFQMCKNRNAFFAIYPFDQYLRNYDRQYHNHMIMKRDEDKKPSHYYMTIDGDRIFGSPGWNLLNEEKSKFECFPEKFHNLLYSIVDDESYKTVMRYAVNISHINESELDLLLKILNDVYNDPKCEHDKIIEILKYRKDKLYDFCDGTCFSNVKKKRLPTNANR